MGGLTPDPAKLPSAARFPRSPQALCTWPAPKAPRPSCPDEPAPGKGLRPPRLRHSAQPPVPRSRASERRSPSGGAPPGLADGAAQNPLRRRGSRSRQRKPSRRRRRRRVPYGAALAAATPSGWTGGVAGAERRSWTASRSPPGWRSRGCPTRRCSAGQRTAPGTAPAAAARLPTGPEVRLPAAPVRSAPWLLPAALEAALRSPPLGPSSGSRQASAVRQQHPPLSWPPRFCCRRVSAHMKSAASPHPLSGNLRMGPLAPGKGWGRPRGAALDSLSSCLTVRLTRDLWWTGF